MSTTEAPAKLITADEFLALPDDGKERWLLNGMIYTLEDSMTVRNWVHSAVAATITGLLRHWVLAQPMPRGRLHSGDAGFRLRRDPEVLIGADIAYASADLVAATPREQAYFDGPPVLAVEILSPSDRQEDIFRKIQLYREAGSVVWIVNPDIQTVQVCFPDRSSKSFDAGDILVGDPYLPGFRVAVADLFDL